MTEEGPPPLHETQWADGDTPHAESVDLNEYPSVLKGIKKCRSFRVDMRHKLEIIVRSLGPWGSGSLGRAARILRVTPAMFSAWVREEKWPGTKNVFDRIDNAYSDALEVLAKHVATNAVKRVKRKQNKVDSQLTVA